MSPVDGNCFQAAIASVLELDLDDVPEAPVKTAPTATEGDQNAWEVYLGGIDRWLEPRGMGLFAIALAEKTRLSDLKDHAVPSGYWIMGITSLFPDNGHCLVARGREIVHDPEQNPLVGDDPEVDAIFAFFLRDPSAWTRPR
jgi:hypothetical protein